MGEDKILDSANQKKVKSLEFRVKSFKIVFFLIAFSLSTSCSLPRIIILDDPLSPEEHINLGVAYEKKGEIVVNFNVWGKWDNLQNDLKESFQKEGFAGIGRTVTSPLEDVAKGLRTLLPSKK